MDGKSHLAAGIVLSAGTIFLLTDKLGMTIDPGTSAYFILGSTVGALLPDVDIDNSMLGRFIPLWLFTEHRTITHSLFFIVALDSIALLLHAPLSLILGLSVGLISHLVLDGITPMGLPYLFFPFRYSQPRKYQRGYRK